MKKTFVEVFNTLIDNKEYFLDKWQQDLVESDELKAYRLKEFRRILEQAQKLQEFDENLCMQMLESIKVIEAKGKFVVTLLEGSNMSYEV